VAFVAAALVASVTMLGLPSAGAAGGVGAAGVVSPWARQRELPSANEVPAPGTGLSPEVAAVPSSSPEADRAEAALEQLSRRREAAAAERAGLEQRLSRDTRELVAVEQLAQRRTAQVDKAVVVDDRSRIALAALTLERFIEGDHLLEGLDPALSVDERVRLERQAVLGQAAAAELVEQRRHTSGRLDSLRADRDAQAARAAELRSGISRAELRRGELDAALAELDAQVTETLEELRRARLRATVDGTEMSTLALDAYWRAERYLAEVDPDCGLKWPLLAGIGRTESRHGTYRGAELGVDGVVAPPIYGPDLDGSNTFAVVPDSDGGRLDGSARTDRAVGPMQFLPGTWRTVGVDLTGDGTADPQNLFDAAAAAGVYLCRSGPGLGDPGRRRAAVLTYNRSAEYADIVEERMQEYAAAVSLR
jgi:membrane-bound lytic murein transglycosylase B